MKILQVNWSTRLKKEVLKRVGCTIDHHIGKKDHSRIWFPDGFSLLVSDFGLGRAPMIAADVGKEIADLYYSIEDVALFHLSPKLINLIAKIAATELDELYIPFYRKCQQPKKEPQCMEHG